MIALRDDQRKKILLSVDGESILFFAGLFMMIGGLEKVHLFETLAKALALGSSRARMCRKKR